MDLILIVGVGGIGSNLFQKLARYAPMNYHICLIDGDTVEPKNLERQMFTQSDIGKNKAEVLAHKANNQLTQRFSYYPYYLETNDYEKFVEQMIFIIFGRFYKNVVIFGCLDNHPARLMLETISKNENFVNRFYSWLYIDGANEKHTGDVVSYLRIDKKNNKGHTVVKEYGAFRSTYDYSVMVDKTNDPNNSCQNDLLDGNIQTLIANDKAAITMLEVFNNYLEGKRCWGLWKFQATKPKNKKRTI